MTRVIAKKVSGIGRSAAKLLNYQ